MSQLSRRQIVLIGADVLAGADQSPADAITLARERVGFGQRISTVCRVVTSSTSNSRALLTVAVQNGPERRPAVLTVHSVWEDGAWRIDSFEYDFTAEAARVVGYCSTPLRRFGSGVGRARSAA